MKFKKRKSLEVPSKIKSFIDRVTSTPLENIEVQLRTFYWEFDKGDFHHWVDLFNRFDSFFEKYIKPRKDLQVEENFWESDSPFPKESVLQILRVIRIILENCTNKHLYSSFEHHLASLLASTDPDVIESCLQTLAAFFRKNIGKYSIRDASLSTKLFSLAQGWGGREEGIGLIASSVPDGCDSVAYDLGCTLHFEFYALNESSGDSGIENNEFQGLQVIHLPNVNNYPESDLELLEKLVRQYKIPPKLRFSLFTRLRFARAFGSLALRQQYTCIRLYAFIGLVQTSNEADDLVSFFHSEPEFENELVSILSYEDVVPENIRILCLLSLVALSQDRSRQPTVLTAITSGGHRGILSSLIQKAIDSVLCESSRWSVIYAEALLSLVTVLVSSSSGCSAMREAGLIPTLLPLLKDTAPQHLHLVAAAVQNLEAFMDYSNPAALLFRELGGLEDTISRLKVEVSTVEASSKQISDDCCMETSVVHYNDQPSSELDNLRPLYSESLVSYHRRLLIKALLRAISLGTYAPGNSSRVCGSEETLLPECLSVIFRNARDFGGGVFSLAANVMSDLIHKDPTCYSVLDATGLPFAYLDAIMDDVVCSAEAIMSIPQCLDALCLNNYGLGVIKERNALRCFIKIFTSKAYLRALSGEAATSISSGLDELMRHATSLRTPGVDVIIEILNTISKIGTGIELNVPTCSAPVPMETDSEDKIFLATKDGISKMECMGPLKEQATSLLTSDVDSCLPELIANSARLLETVLQNADTCRIFVERKGVEAVMQMFSLPLMPVSTSIGQNLSVAFKNFSPQHSISLVRTVCSFLRQHLKSTKDLLHSVEGMHFLFLEPILLKKVLKQFSSLDGILSLSEFLLKGTPSILSELSYSDAEILKDLGKIYKDIIWQLSMYIDAKIDEKRRDQENEGLNKSSTSSAGRDIDDDPNTFSVRYLNTVSTRSSSDRDFLSAFRSGEGLHRRSRHNLARIRGGRSARHLEALSFEHEVPQNAIESPSADLRKKSPEVVTLEILNRVVSSMRAFLTSIVKGITSPNRRRAEIGYLSSASKTLATTIGIIYFEALSFSGYCNVGVAISPSIKCRYLGKVVNDMGALMFDSRRRSCYAVMVNSFYVHETFKELLTTFEATSQLLWTPPYVAMPAIDSDGEVGRQKLSHRSLLLETLKCYCRVLEYFVNPSFLLPPTSISQAQLLVQPVTVGLSIGLFPVPKNPEAFVRMLQSQVLDVMLPVWTHPMFPNCCPGFIACVVSLLTHIYGGIGDVKRTRNNVVGGVNHRHLPPPIDESNVATIVEMGFSRARAEEALRRVETNSVEMAMEWLFSHADDPALEDDELARALALSLGSSAEGSKNEIHDKSVELNVEEEQLKELPVDDLLSSCMKLFQSCEAVAFSLSDLFVTICNRRKGEDRMKVVGYLIQQLKFCPLDFSTDSSSLCMLSHALALLLSEDDNLRYIACQNGIVAATLHILMDFKEKNDLGKLVASRCISSLLLILDNMLHSKPRKVVDTSDKTQPRNHNDSSSQVSVLDNKVCLNGSDREFGTDNYVMGNSTGYLTTEESQKLTLFACELVKHEIPPIVMQAVLQLCAHLTRNHPLALQFLDNGGLVALFNLQKSCFFPGYDTIASSIVRHLLEDPQTLQTAMEFEIKQTLNGTQNSGRILPRVFLTSMAPVICRDPSVFMKAVTATCHLETSAGRKYVVLSKEKEKEKSKASFGEDSVKIIESKLHDGTTKCLKGHKKIPINLTQVIDQLLDIVLNCTLEKLEEFETETTTMEIDEPTKAKGKSKVEDSSKKVSESERSAWLAKLTFILKLLSDIVLMHAHAVGVILKRDSELCQQRATCQAENVGEGGVLHHILHRILPLSYDKSTGLDEWRTKLSDKASWFLVVVSSRSGEGRRRLIAELVKAINAFTKLGTDLSNNILVPDKKSSAIADVVYSLISKSTSSSNLPGSGFSPEMAKSMIDGGMVQCLAGFLQIIDLDHPDAPKIVNLLVKSLETLTRAANSGDQYIKSEGLNKRKSTSSNGRLETLINLPASETNETSQTDNVPQEAHNEEETERRQRQRSSSFSGSHDADQSAEQDMRIDMEETTAANAQMDLGTELMHEGDGVLHTTDHIGMNFQVENRADDDIGDDDDDMVDDGEEDEDEDGDEEDEDIAEDGGGMMLADTDVEDHDDTGLGDEYNDDIVDEEDDDFHVNRVIEVRWREALDGLDRLQVLGQPGAANGLLDVVGEPFDGVFVDDIYGLRRSLGFERQRHSRASFERSLTEPNGFQHPLLVRPSRSVDSLQTSSRNVESSSGAHDVSHFCMFDAPVLPAEHFSTNLFSDRVGYNVTPPLNDYLVGMDSLQIQGRRGPSDGRWTDGQHQVGSHAELIAQALEARFMREMHSVSATSDARRQSFHAEFQNPSSAVEAPTMLVVNGPANGSQPVDVPMENGLEVACDRSDGNVCIAQEACGATAEREVVAVHSVSFNSTPSRRDCNETSVCNGNNDFVNDVQTGVDFPVEVQISNFPTTDGHDLSCAVSENSLLHFANPDNEITDFNMVAGDQIEQSSPSLDNGGDAPSSIQEAGLPSDAVQAEQTPANSENHDANVIDPTFLDALPEELRAEVLATRQAPPVQPSAYVPPSVDDIDPDCLAALPPDIQAEILAHQRAQRIVQQAEGHPVDMDNASIIATFPAELREEVFLTSSDAVISALTTPLLAEAQMLRDRAMSHYQARSLFGTNHRLSNRRNGLGFDRQAVMDRGVGVAIGRRAAMTDNIKVSEVEGRPLLEENALQGLIRLLRLAQPLGKGLLQRLLLNLCAHSVTREMLIRLLLDMIKPEADGSPNEVAAINPKRLYGCQSNVVYGRSQFLNGLPPLVLRRILEILTYLATNHSSISQTLFCLKKTRDSHPKIEKCKSRIEDGDEVPLVMFLKLLSRPIFVSSIAHLEQVVGLIQVVVYAASSKLDGPPQPPPNESTHDANTGNDSSLSDGKNAHILRVFLGLPERDLRNLCSLLGREGLSEKLYMLAGEVLKKLASIAVSHRKFFTSELSQLVLSLSSSAAAELVTLKNTSMLGLSTASMAGAATLRVLQVICSLNAHENGMNSDGDADHAVFWNLNTALEPLWRGLSDCIAVTETQLGNGGLNAAEQLQGTSLPPIPPGIQRLLPFIEAFFVLCEKLQTNHSLLLHSQSDSTAREIKASSEMCSSSDASYADSQKKVECSVTFTRFAEKHRRLLNTFIRQNPGLLEKSLCMMLKAPRLIDFDNKRAYFRSRIRQQHEHNLSGPVRISVRRAYVLEDSYNQLRMRSSQDLRGRLNVQFQGEEGIDAGGLTREWYQLLSRVIFDKGALLFTTVGNNSTFQPNPNSVYQTEHLSYFKFAGRVVAKALFDGQLLDVYFTRSFYKHILGVKVTYHDIEAVDPDYYKNLKWMLENDVNDILDLTFSMDPDEEKQILYEKTEVTDHELKPGGRNIRVTEETKHEYVDLVADHILTNAIRPQINSFLEGFNELVPRELISIFNDKELELLISGLPEIDLDDLKANAEYSGYSAASPVIQWFWDVVKEFSTEDRARLLQFVTGTSKVPLEGFRALQGISGPQRFQIHRAYGAPERLPSAHTCFNQLDLPEYATREQLRERLLLAIHEASEGFGFG